MRNLKLKNLVTVLLLGFSILSGQTVNAVNVEVFAKKPTTVNHILEIRFKAINPEFYPMTLTLDYLNSKNHHTKVIIIDSIWGQTLGKDFSLYDTSQYEGPEQYCAGGSVLFPDFNYAIKQSCFEHYEKENFLRIIRNPIVILSLEEQVTGSDIIDLRFGIENSTPNEPFSAHIVFSWEDLNFNLVKILDTIFMVTNQSSVVSLNFPYNFPTRGRCLADISIMNSYAGDQAYVATVLNPLKPKISVNPENSIITTGFYYKNKGNLKITVDGVTIKNSEVPSGYEFLYPIGDDIKVIVTDLLGGETIFSLKTLGFEIVSLKGDYAYEFYDYTGVKLNSRPTTIGFAYIEVIKDKTKENLNEKDQIVSVKKCLVRTQ